MIQERVISTMALVLEQFITKVKVEIPNAKFVYDEKLSYETAITKFRADNNIGSGQAPNETLPLFAFKRSVLRHSEKGMGRRATTGIVNFSNTVVENQRDVFKIVHGEMDIDFLFIVKSAQDSELFEIEYLSETGLPKQKELLVDTREDLGTDLQYFVDYGPLSDKVIESDNNFFKGISGSAKVTGFYPVFKTTSKVILSVGGIYGFTNGNGLNSGVGSGGNAGSGSGVGSGAGGLGIGSGANIYDETITKEPTPETVIGNISIEN